MTYLFIGRFIFTDLYRQSLLQIFNIARLDLRPLISRKTEGFRTCILKNWIIWLHVLELKAGNINFTETSLAISLLQIYQMGISNTDSIKQKHVIFSLVIIGRDHFRLALVILSQEFGGESLQRHGSSWEVLIFQAHPVEVSLLREQWAFTSHCSSPIH